MEQQARQVMKSWPAVLIKATFDHPYTYFCQLTDETRLRFESASWRSPTVYSDDEREYLAAASSTAARRCRCSSRAEPPPRP